MEHETGGRFGPEGRISEKLEPKKSLLPEPDTEESGENSSDEENEPELDQGVKSGAHQKAPAAVQNCTTRLPATLNPSRRVAREVDATLPRSRLLCARWTSTICHRNRPRSAKLRRPWNGQIGSAHGKSEVVGHLARQASVPAVFDIAAVKHWRAAKRALQYL